MKRKKNVYVGSCQREIMYLKTVTLINQKLLPLCWVIHLLHRKQVTSNIFKKNEKERFKKWNMAHLRISGDKRIKECIVLFFSPSHPILRPTLAKISNKDFYIRLTFMIKPPLFTPLCTLHTVGVLGTSVSLTAEILKLIFPHHKHRLW